MNTMKQDISSREPRWYFSAPGRIELSGNHTDHQHGKVLTAAINMDIKAVVARNDNNVIRIVSDGFPPCEVNLSDLAPRDSERGTSASLIRGVASYFREAVASLAGFDAALTSTVLPGRGLSSSAAFEVLIGTVINTLFYDGRASDPDIARAGQYAENNYYGKPCGLMDQMASSIGGIAAIDFADPDHPLVEKLELDFSVFGHSLCLIDTGASHAGLTDHYAAIPTEMRHVSLMFGADYLRDVQECIFYSRLAEVRERCGDRASLRAMHYFAENERVAQQTQALRMGDFPLFLNLVKESGRSSWMLLQNVIPDGQTARQEAAVALALAERLLAGRGAVRIHGGGFGGTVLAFVPNDILDDFRNDIEAVFGSCCCHVLSIRNTGGTLLEEIE